jgi:hypothetical protein
MSFKLVGDNYSAQHSIRKRRVEELLSNSIPCNEALLMKNGRYCCTVCPHRPIFDTIEILTLHRKGNKHMTNANRRCAMESEKVEEIKKRIQVGESKDAEALAPLLEQVKTATSKALTSTQPYSAIASRKRQSSTTTPSLDCVSSSKACDSHVTSNNVHSTVPLEIKDYEFVQPWNAGYSGKRKTSKPRNKVTASSVKGSKVGSLYIERSGWKRQKNGEWVKDSDAEFDSESEEDC